MSKILIKIRRFAALLLLLSICIQTTFGQDLFERKIKLSGIVLRLDSLTPIQSANIFLKHNMMGVRSDQLGMFSIDVAPSDTLVFSAIGSKTTYFIVPFDLDSSSYSIIQRMPLDTIQLHTVEVTSWPSLEQFNEAFTKEYGFDRKYLNAHNNANPSMAEINLEGVVMDANRNYKMEGMRYANRYSYIYENAHVPVDQIMNPYRWEMLIESWKKGKR